MIAKMASGGASSLSENSAEEQVKEVMEDFIKSFKSFANEERVVANADAHIAPDAAIQAAAGGLLGQVSGALAGFMGAGAPPPIVGMLGIPLDAVTSFSNCRLRAC